MNKVLSRLGVKTDSLEDVNMSYEFCDDGKLLLHLSNSKGETKTEVAHWKR